MLDGQAQLQAIANELKGGGSHTETVRTLLQRFGFERRGLHKARYVRQALKMAGLLTEPDFMQAWIDAPITFRLIPSVVEVGASATVSIRAAASGECSAPGTSVVVDENSTKPETHVEAPAAEKALTHDPTYRINRIDAANKGVVAVSPSDNVSQAVTLMMLHDFSQLPVMTGPRSLQGAISWKSLGKRLALNRNLETVQEAMERDVAVVPDDANLFSTIPAIIQSDFVLVQARDKTISGIVTTADLSEKFKELAEPFLLLGEVESHIRTLLDTRFTLQELVSARDENDSTRPVNSASDLTFGEYIRLLERPEAWEKVAIRLDRKQVVKALSDLREIRNDVMHFDPEGIGGEDLAQIRAFVRFLQDLRAAAAI